MQDCLGAWHWWSRLISKAFLKSSLVLARMWYYSDHSLTNEGGLRSADISVHSVKRDLFLTKTGLNNKRLVLVRHRSPCSKKQFFAQWSMKHRKSKWSIENCFSASCSKKQFSMLHWSKQFSMLPCSKKQLPNLESLVLRVQSASSTSGPAQGFGSRIWCRARMSLMPHAWNMFSTLHIPQLAKDWARLLDQSSLVVEQRVLPWEW